MARTGLVHADAEKRVNDVIALVKAAEAKVRQTADAACKAGAYLAIYTGVRSGHLSRRWQPRLAAVIETSSDALIQRRCSTRVSAGRANLRWLR